jgi:hypothetical protein
MQTSEQVKTMYDKLIKEIGWNNQIEIDSCIDAAMKLLDSPEFLKIFQDPSMSLFFKRETKTHLTIIDFIERFQQVRQIIVMSIDLCFKIGHTWKYTYDEFIRKKLWPLLPKPVVNDVVIELLGNIKCVNEFIVCSDLGFQTKVYWVARVFLETHLRRMNLELMHWLKS